MPMLADAHISSLGYLCIRWQNRLQNSSYFCVFKYGRAVKQKVCNEAENRERDWACEARALLARKTLTPRFTDFFTDFEKKKKPIVLQCTDKRKSILVIQIQEALWRIN